MNNISLSVLNFDDFEFFSLKIVMSFCTIFLSPVDLKKKKLLQNIARSPDCLFPKRFIIIELLAKERRVFLQRMILIKKWKWQKKRNIIIIKFFWKRMYSTRSADNINFLELNFLLKCGSKELEKARMIFFCRAMRTVQRKQKTRSHGSKNQYLFTFTVS